MKLKLNKSKTILIAFAAFLLVFATVFTTVAYLTDTDDVHNTLTVGKVKIELRDGGADDAQLWETTTHKNENQQREIKLIPGQTIDFDPTIWVIDTNTSCYLFVKIEPDTTVKKIFGDFIDSNWTALGKGYENIYVYGALSNPTKVDNGAKVNIIKGDGLTVDGKVTNAENWDIKITAYAIQSEYLKDDNGSNVTTAVAAWNLLNDELANN